jgi:membrane-associated protease RseP (regulator of RpoE activity)
MTRSTTTRTLTIGALALATGLGLATYDPTPANAQPGGKIQLHPNKQGGARSFGMTMQSRGRLGAKVITMSEDLRRYFGSSGDLGLLVDSVLPDTPASKAGLRAGDVIVAVEGRDIAETWDIFSALSESKKGDKVKIEVLRDKKRKTLTATLDDDGGSAAMGRIQLGGTGNFNFDFDPDQFFKGMGPGMWGHAGASPFGPSQSDLQEKVRRLEERLERLEGKKGSKKRSHKRSSGPKS